MYLSICFLLVWIQSLQEGNGVLPHKLPHETKNQYFYPVIYVFSSGAWELQTHFFTKLYCIGAIAHLFQLGDKICNFLLNNNAFLEIKTYCDLLWL